MKTPIRWAPKLRPELLRKLYAMSASGVFDDELLDAAGIRLYLRCEAIVMISRRQFYCPECGIKAEADNSRSECEAQFCGGCGFSFTKKEYAESFRHKDLIRGNAGAYFEKFYLGYPKAKTTGEKIILIDTLIHSFHIDVKSGLPNRAAGNNLIEGSLEQVVLLLDELSGVQPENDARFANTASIMWKRRRGAL